MATSDCSPEDTKLGSSDGSGTESDPDHTPDPSLGNTDWCSCGNCIPMLTARESICCQESGPLTPKLSDGECITTNSPRFYWICMDVDALEVAMLSIADMKVDRLLRPIASRYALNHTVGTYVLFKPT